MAETEMSRRCRADATAMDSVGGARCKKRELRLRVKGGRELVATAGWRLRQSSTMPSPP
jgi:hypothetical protein